MTRRKLKYRPAAHAIERLREYFGVKEIHALDFTNDFMEKAQFVTNQADGRKLYKNDSVDAMAVVAQDNTVITYLPAPEKRREIERTGNPVKLQEESEVKSSENVFLASFQSTVKRELTKARRQFVRESRKLTEEIAVIGLEIAQLNLNKARARSPITQRQIADKVAHIHEEQTKLAERRKQLEAQFRAMKSEVSGFVAE